MAGVDEHVLDESRRRALEERSNKVDELIRSTRFAEAVGEALSNPPLGTKDAELKEDNARVVNLALAAVPDKESAITKVVESLSSDQHDVLMKYIYRALQNATNCGAMLKWHGVLFKHSGIGCIVRTLTDRKTV